MQLALLASTPEIEPQEARFLDADGRAFAKVAQLGAEAKGSSISGTGSRHARIPLQSAVGGMIIGKSPATDGK